MHRLVRHISRAALLALLGLAGFVAPLAAQDAGNLLPVTEAYKLAGTIVAPGTIHLHWTIAPHYYLYRGRISVKAAGGAVKLGALQLPDGLKEHDPYLGDIEIYHNSIDATLPYTVLDAHASSIRLAVKYQGCHEVDPKICYPPHTTDLTLALPAASAPAPAEGGTPAAASPGGARLGGDGGTMTGKAPLPAAQAFRFEAIASSPDTLLLRWTMPKGYYLYRDRTTLKLAGDSGVTLGAPQWPSGVALHDPNFGESIVYFAQVEVPLPITRGPGSGDHVKLRARFQGCKENDVCYPVMTRTVDVALPPAAGGSSAAAGPGTAVTAGPAAPGAATTLLGALLLALGGGLLLNLMPCVLPVLSLKAVSLVESREGSRATHHHALAYTAGVLLSFAAVGLAVVALRAAGMASGWGFQLQQPVFVAVLVYVLLAMGLSYSGVVHFGAGLAGTGQSLTAKSGLAGDFFTGVLAVVVASPCTAPAMGAALAFAFAAPWYWALLVFVMLGLGLALPFLLIGYFPALGRWLPRPGAWMETLKQVLAFPLYLTAAWLAWVLANQRGADGVGLLLVGAVLLAMALWWSERSRHRGVPSKILAGVLLLVSLVPLALIHGVRTPAAAAARSSDMGVVAFTPARLAALRKQGTPVFVDMTADWCITCKANEHTVLDTDAFRDLLKRTGTVYMKGDWTNENPDITAFLQRWHSPGVPVYVVFPKGGGPGHKLPSVLTPGIVRAAIQHAVQ